MGKSPCCAKVGLKRGPWSPEEDQKLLAYIAKNVPGSWGALPGQAGLQRCGKSCRLRWRNYLRPDIKRGKFSMQEEQTIIQLHALLGNRWSVIANQLPKRTDNEIRNHWNTHLKKRLLKMGIDPVTHKRKSNALGSIESKDTASINHLAQWETTRLEAEGRTATKSKLNLHPQVGLSGSAESFNKATTQRPAPPPLLPIALPCLDVLKASQGAWIKPNGFFSPKGSLTSPTSTLHFLDDMLSSSPKSFGANFTIPEINCFDSSNVYEVGIAEEHIQNNELEIKGIRVNRCAQQHDFPHPIDAGNEDISGSLGISSFMKGFAGPCWPNDSQQRNNQAGPCDHNCDGNMTSPCVSDLEENERFYWKSYVNSVTFTSGSTMF